MNWINSVLGIGSTLIDKLVTDKDQANQLKTELTKQAMSGQLEHMKGSVQVLTAELNGNWLQRSWRPLTMLTFVGLVVAHWLGFTATNLSEPERLAVMDIIQIGLGGYVVGRSAEKIADKWNPIK